jgi:hypothetical protein
VDPYIGWRPGESVAAVLAGDRIQLFDFAHGRPVGQPVPYGEPTGIATTAGAHQFAFGDKDTNLVLASPGQPGFKRCSVPLAERNPDGGRDWIQQIAYSPDGSMLAAARGSGGLMLCSAPAGELIAFDGLLNRDVAQVALGADRKTLAAFMDSSVALFDVDPSSWAGRLCARASSNFSQEEWREIRGGEPYRCTCSNLPAGEGAPPNAPGCHAGK